MIYPTSSLREQGGSVARRNAGLFLNIPRSTAMNLAKHRIALAVALTAAALGSQAQAGQLSATRLIFGNGSKDASITYTNPSDRCVGLFVWTSDVAVSDPATARAPIALLQPPKMIVAGGQTQSLRFRYLGQPQDGKESVYWLSTHEVAVDESLCKRGAGSAAPNAATAPADDAALDAAMKASLEVAVRTYIKVLVRPKTLKGSYLGAADGLRWSVQHIGGKNWLVVNNPTGYHAHFSSVSVTSGGRTLATLEGRKGGMANPMGETRFELDRAVSGASLRVNATVINDQGGSVAKEWSL
jgi:P pilus assembly chaperone PapD